MYLLPFPLLFIEIIKKNPIQNQLGFVLSMRINAKKKMHFTEHKLHKKTVVST